MKQINSMEELREYCFGKAKHKSTKYVCFDNWGGNQKISEWSNKPICNGDVWGSEIKEHIFNGDDNCNISLNFNCDFSKCCWSVE